MWICHVWCLARENLMSICVSINLGRMRFKITTRVRSWTTSYYFNLTHPLNFKLTKFSSVCSVTLVLYCTNITVTSHLTHYYLYIIPMRIQIKKKINRSFNQIRQQWMSEWINPLSIYPLLTHYYYFLMPTRLLRHLHVREKNHSSIYKNQSPFYISNAILTLSLFLRIWTIEINDFSFIHVRS